MGCFSFLCSECKEPVNETEVVKLFLWKDGKIIQEMEGEYDCYGRVDGDDWELDWGDVMDLWIKGEGHRNYNVETSRELNKLAREMNSKIVRFSDTKDLFKEDFCEDEWFEEPVPGNGLVAIHSACFRGIVPDVPSLHDPNQGGGEPNKRHLR